MNYEMLKFLILSIGPSLLVFTLIQAFALKPWRSFHSEEFQAQPQNHWGGTLGIALGYMAVHWRIEGVPDFLPKQNWHWLFQLSFASLIVGLLSCALYRYSRWIPWVLALLLAGVAGFLLVPKFQANASSWQFAVGGTILIWWIALNSLAERQVGMSMPAIFLVTSLAASYLILQAGSAKFAQLVGTLGALAGLGIFFSWWSAAAFSFARGSIFSLSVLIPGLLFSTYFYNGEYTDIPFSCYVGVLIAPVFAWFGQLLGKESAPWKRFFFHLIIVILILGISLLKIPPQEPLY